MACHDHGSDAVVTEKALVLYAGDRLGADAVAAVVAQVLASQGADVTVRSAADCEGAQGYGLVVIGIELWKGDIVPEMLAFVRGHEDALASTRTACFAVSVELKDRSQDNLQRAVGRLLPLTDLVKPVDVAIFGGALDLAKLPALSRLIHWPSGRRSRDHRDWDAIRFWAGGLLGKARGEERRRGQGSGSRG